MIDDKPYYAILEGHNVLPVDNIFIWGKWFETANRVVEKTKIGPFEISTVFLGINHAFFSTKKQLWFETMIFGMKNNVDDVVSRFCERYETWDDAVEGHKYAISLVRSNLSYEY